MIVTNTTFQAAPWADVLYAMDKPWWQKYHKEVEAGFEGEKIAPVSGCYNARRVQFGYGGNSGAGALALAAHFGARRIIMLGYDCKYAADGRRHWHGNHPKGLGNAVSLPHWLGQFDAMAKQLAGVEIINATRDTALEFWPRVPLESALGY